MPGEPPSCLENFIDSSGFSSVMTTVIVINTVFIGVDQAFWNAENEDHIAWL